MIIPSFTTYNVSLEYGKSQTSTRTSTTTTMTMTRATPVEERKVKGAPTDVKDDTTKHRPIYSTSSYIPFVAPRFFPRFLLQIKINSFGRCASICYSSCDDSRAGKRGLDDQTHRLYNDNNNERRSTDVVVVAVMRISSITQAASIWLDVEV